MIGNIIGIERSQQAHILFEDTNFSIYHDKKAGKTRRTGYRRHT